MLYFGNSIVCFQNVRAKNPQNTHTLCLCCSARSVTSAILEARDNSSIRTYKYKYKHKFEKCEHNER